MSPVWVNGRFLSEKPNRKVEKWKPEQEKGKALWGLCLCGEPIYEGDSVGMFGDHEHVICYSCWLEGSLAGAHLDCAGLKLPEIALSN